VVSIALRRGSHTDLYSALRTDCMADLRVEIGKRRSVVLREGDGDGGSSEDSVTAANKSAKLRLCDLPQTKTIGLSLLLLAIPGSASGCARLCK
jgi:hypothetical protein